MSTAQSNSADGRVLRRERNRQAIVEALLGLYEEGRIEVNAALIVEKAGLSERSLFRYFDDLDDLYRTACDTHFEKMSQYAAIVDFAKGSLFDKIEHFVNQRMRIFQATRNIAIVARIHAHTNAPVKQQLHRGRALLRQQCMTHFHREFQDMSRTQRLAVIAAIDVLASFESFELLRQDQGLSHADTKSVLAISITKLFTEEQ